MEKKYFNLILIVIVLLVIGCKKMYSISKVTLHNLENGNKRELTEEEIHFLDNLINKGIIEIKGKKYQVWKYLEIKTNKGKKIDAVIFRNGCIEIEDKYYKIKSEYKDRFIRLIEE